MVHRTITLHNSLVLIVLVLGLSACHKESSPSSDPSSTAKQSQTAEKRYHLIGQVVSISKPSKTVNVDSQAIPGFMEAMTMTYPVKPESQLDQLSTGDRITGDVVVNDSGMWLEKIVVTSHSGTPGAK